MTQVIELEASVAEARACVRGNKEQEGLVMFQRLLEQQPESATVWFEYAGALDYLGNEKDAESGYKKARALGLTPEQLKRWYVQYGSTLRNVGDFEGSLALLDEGVAMFPAFLPIKIFRALTLHAKGASAAAVGELIELLLAEAPPERFAHYARSLKGYAAAEKESIA